MWYFCTIHFAIFRQLDTWFGSVISWKLHFIFLVWTMKQRVHIFWKFQRTGVLVFTLQFTQETGISLLFFISNFLILISLQPDVVDLWFLKFLILHHQLLTTSCCKDIRVWVSARSLLHSQLISFFCKLWRTILVLEKIQLGGLRVYSAWRVLASKRQQNPV